MEIKAFKGYRFNQEVVGDPGRCVSPPYDVIDSDMQQKLLDKSPYNIVRIIRPQSNSDIAEKKYENASEFFSELIETGALKQDLKDSIYAYTQDFEIDGNTFCRSGFTALCKLEDFGKGVHPHEKTLDGPKADRLNLMRATAAQFGQIFMIYDDPSKIEEAVIAKASSKQALVDFTDDNKTRHRLFAIDDEVDINAIVNMMLSREAIIADGHHRYETALNYYNETKNPAAQYRMMTFVNMQNEGLIILPTHRLVAGLEEFDKDKLISQIEQTFEVKKYSFSDDQSKVSARHQMFELMKKQYDSGQHAFGIYTSDGSFYTAVLKDTESIDRAVPNISPASRSLDVIILHKLIIENILGVGDKHLASQSNIEYIKDIGDAIDRSVDKVDSGKSQIVFFMNPPKIEQVRAVAAAGEKMPQKSTFFHPKIFSGLVINKL